MRDRLSRTASPTPPTTASRRPRKVVFKVVSSDAERTAQSFRRVAQMTLGAGST
jgi:hypothetical protein